MAASPVYTPLLPDDAAAFAALVRQGFGVPAERAERYRELFGDQAFRVLRRERAVS